jgi:HIP---CoA ligase
MSAAEPLRTIPAVAQAAAERWPDELWLDADGEQITFGELSERVHAIARALHAQGVGPGSRVGLYMGNRALWLETQYALAALGAWLIPLNTMLTAPELANLVAHSRMDTVIWVDAVLDRDTTGRLREVLDLGGRFERMIGVGDADWPAETVTWEEVMAAGRDADDAAVDAITDGIEPDDVGMVIYTSGTTGAPKGVLQTHRALTASMERYARHLGLRPGDRSIFAAPLFWIHGCWHQALVPLFAGSGLVLEQRFDAEAVLQRITSAKVTHLQGVPPHYELLLGHPNSADYDLSGLRVIQVGGTTFSETLPARLRERAPDAVMLAAYGLSEAGCVAYTPLGASLEDIATTIGTVHEGGESRVVDPADDSIVLGPGETGELLLRADCVTIGYLDNPEQTDRALAGGWLHTGDLARQDERGYITIVGRNQDAYKRAGATVYTADAEAVLNEHPSVDLATVVGTPDEALGQVGVAFVVRCDDDLTEDALLAYTSGRLARYKIPAEVRFVSELPMTPSGKIQKHVLKQRVVDEAASTR